MTIGTSPGVRKKRLSSRARNSSMRSSRATASSASRASCRAVNEAEGVSTQLKRRRLNENGYHPAKGGWHLSQGSARPVALDLDHLLEGRAVLPWDQRRLDRRCRLLPDRVPAHLVVALAHRVGRPDRRLLVADLVVAVDLLHRRVDRLRQGRREHRAASLQLPAAAVAARVAAAHAADLQHVTQVL